MEKPPIWEKWEKTWESFLEVLDLELKVYFKPIYEATDSALYYPSRRSAGIFITKLFIAGGSHHFILPQGIVKSNHVETQRKIFNGSFEFTPEQKASFHRVSIDGLTTFFRKAVPDKRIRDLMRSFGIPDDMGEDADMFCKALAHQFEAFVHSTTQEADDLILLKYRQLLEDGDDKSEGSTAARYPGDKMNVSVGRGQQYQVNCYETIRHTWIIENRGTVEWRGRRLYLTNFSDIKLKFENTYIDVPVMKPGEKTKIATSIEARGQEGTTVFQWIMVDDTEKNCFPDEEALFISVEVIFKPKTGK